jgi:hypothetical protein
LKKRPDVGKDGSERGLGDGGKGGLRKLGMCGKFGGGEERVGKWRDVDGVWGGKKADVFQG